MNLLQQYFFGLIKVAIHSATAMPGSAGSGPFRVGREHGILMGEPFSRTTHCMTAPRAPPHALASVLLLGQASDPRCNGVSLDPSVAHLATCSATTLQRWTRSRPRCTSTAEVRHRRRAHGIRASSDVAAALRELRRDPGASLNLLWVVAAAPPNPLAAWGLPSADPACLATGCYLRLIGVEHHTEDCNNDHSSPSGQLPFLRRANDALVRERYSLYETFNIMMSISLNVLRLSDAHVCRR